MSNARRRQDKWKARIVQTLERAGEPLTFSQLRGELSKLTASDTWFETRLRELLTDGLISWDPLQDEYST